MTGAQPIEQKAKPKRSDAPADEDPAAVRRVDIDAMNGPRGSRREESKDSVGAARASRGDTDFQQPTTVTEKDDLAARTEALYPSPRARGEPSREGGRNSYFGGVW